MPAQFTEAKTFLWSILEDPELKPYVRRLKQWEKRHGPKRSRREASSSQDPEAPIPRLLRLLPPKHQADELVRAYFANSEKTLRVLHAPSFTAACETFYADSAAAPFGFVPQLAVVLAAASNTDRLYGDRIHAPQPAHELPSKAALCSAVQDWLEGLKKAERMELAVLQTRTVLLLCQHNVFLPNDMTWQATGQLVRRAMLLGLHRDPGNSKELTPLDVELRRRLWATIVEIDLQTSLVWGLPMAVSHANYDTQPPANIDDSDLSAVTAAPPAPKPLETWSDTLLQTILARTLPVRLRVGNFLNDLRQDPDHSKRQRLGQELEGIISALPAIAKPETYEHESSPDRPGRLLGRILLDISIRRMLLYLYRPFAMNASDTKVFYRARRVCRESALAVLSHQEAFGPRTGEFEAADAADCWTLFDTACRHDVLLAALSVCWEIRMMGSSRSREPGDRESGGGTSWTKAQLMRVADEAVAGLLDKVDMPGGFLKDVVGVSVILESVKNPGSQETRESRMRATVADILTRITTKLESRTAATAEVGS